MAEGADMDTSEMDDVVSASRLHMEGVCNRLVQAKTEISTKEACIPPIMDLIKNYEANNSLYVEDPGWKLATEMVTSTRKEITKIQKQVSNFECALPNCNKHDNAPLRKKPRTVVDKVKNNNDFILPPKRLTVPSSQMIVPNNNVIDIANPNRFEHISENGEDVDVQIEMEDKPPPATPIFMQMFPEQNQVMKEICEKFGKDVTFKLSGEFVKIFPQSSDNHRQVTTFLKQKGIDHFITSPKTDRPIKVVIKGLPINTSVTEIELELNDMGYHPQKVIRLNRIRSKQPLPIFLIHLPRTLKPTEITKIDRFMYYTVVIAPFENRKGFSQCFNCNKFSHSSGQCFMKARCLKCGLNHSTRDCKLDKVENPKCINCNKVGHVASWRGCERFPKTKEQKEYFGQLARKDISYSQATTGQRYKPRPLNQSETSRGGTSQPTIVPLNLQNLNTGTGSLLQGFNFNELKDMFELFKEISSIFTGGVSQLLKQIKQAKSAEDKFQIIMENFSTNQCSNN